jgi:hypothetical protein
MWWWSGGGRREVCQREREKNFVERIQETRIFLGNEIMDPTSSHTVFYECGEGFSWRQP